jgi:hypothetical protein
MEYLRNQQRARHTLIGSAVAGLGVSALAIKYSQWKSRKPGEKYLPWGFVHPVMTFCNNNANALSSWHVRALISVCMRGARLAVLCV